MPLAGINRNAPGPFQGPFRGNPGGNAAGNWLYDSGIGQMDRAEDYKRRNRPADEAFAKDMLMSPLNWKSNMFDKALEATGNFDQSSGGRPLNLAANRGMPEQTVWNPQQRQEEINAGVAGIQKGAATNINQARKGMAGSVGANSPLLQMMGFQQNAMANSASAQARRDIGMKMDQANREQQNKSLGIGTQQQAIEQSGRNAWMQSETARRNALISGLFGIL